MPIQEKILNNFSRAAMTYDDHACVQALTAKQLIENIRHEMTDLIEGPVLELGCGTGFLTCELANLFRERQLLASDLSEAMLAKCQSRLKSDAQNLQFQIMDASSLLEPDCYALIVSSFALQWLPDLKHSLVGLIRSLRPQGKLIFSLPSNKSFQQWKVLCRKTSVPFTGNDLPSGDDIVQVARENGAEITCYEESFTIGYTSMLDFFQALKRSGAATQVTGRQLLPQQLKALLKSAEQEGPGFSITYHVLRTTIVKDGGRYS